jgi:hypothetical protein
MQDSFIVCKHAQMLTDAGIDMLLFDTSDGYNYEKTVSGLLDVYLQMRAQGLNTPQLAFHTVAGTDFTLNGDAAPNDRFNYRANFGGR